MKAPAWRLPPERNAADAIEAWIPMADGVRLSARLWIPTGAPGERFPSVLEYIPYRKQDAYRGLDEVWGAALASHGFAYARVDVRGSGDSEGVLTDEYSAQELEDGCAVIAWLAAQAWCTGKVGMRGLSWGGINTLQIAAMRPPALAAIMPMGCMDDRYTDDAHYIGGALGHTNLQWGIGFKTVMAGPPDPLVVGEAWEAMWRERLEATPPILQTWLEHQRYDDYWRRGSIREDWDAIQVPTYIVGGWQDTYAAVVGRLLENLTCPRKALIGPWGHTYPWAAQPQGLDWVHEEVRWWDHWLNGAVTGIMDEPMLRAFMPYAAASEVIPAPIPGRWIAEPAWPPTMAVQTLHPTGERLYPAPGPTETVRYRADEIVGLSKPEWLDRPPTDQLIDDVCSLAFQTPVLEEDLEVFGEPVLRVRIAADQPVAKLAVRLVELTSVGGSWLVTWGLLNLTHRDSHAEPQPLIPGQAYDIDIPLRLIAHRFRAGNRIGLSISESLWPMVWPSPRTVTLSVTLGEATRLVLPVRAVEAEPEPFPIPESTTPPPDGAAKPATITARVTPGVYRIELKTPPTPSVVKATGASLERSRWEVSEIREDNPNSCVWTHRALSRWTRGDWDCAVEATCELTSTETEFHVREGLTASLRAEVIFERNTSARIKRDLV